MVLFLIPLLVMFFFPGMPVHAEETDVHEISLESFLASSTLLASASAPTKELQGTLQLSVNTVREKTPRQWSIMPHRIEVWTKDKLLMALSNGESQVENSRHRRVFKFPDLSLDPGYYYLSLRGYAEGFISRDQKWKGKTIQIGIHPGRTTVVAENLQMFVW